MEVGNMEEEREVKIYSLNTPGANINLIGEGKDGDGNTLLYNQPHACMPFPPGFPEDLMITDVDILLMHDDVHFEVLDTIPMDYFEELVEKGEATRYDCGFRCGCGHMHFDPPV
jgi:hypothetical protein